MFNKKFMFAVVSVVLAVIISLSTMVVFAAGEVGGNDAAAIETVDTKEATDTDSENTDLTKMAGDVDGDKDITINDVTTYQLILVGKQSSTPVFELNAETVTDGKKNITDVTGIQAYVAKVLKKLPITPDGYYSEIIRP